MRNIGLIAILCFTNLLVAGEFGNNALEVLHAARDNHQAIAVLYRGSDWMTAGEMFFKKIWQTEKFREKFAKDCVWANIDYLENDGEKNKVTNENWKGLKPGIDAYPAIAVYDHDGVLIALQNNVALTTDLNLDLAIDFMSKILALKKERDAAFARAASLNGVEKATALGAMLAKLSAYLSNNQLKEYYRDKLEEIKNADSADQSGYGRRFNFNVGEFRQRVMKLAGEKNFAEGEKILNEELNNERNRVFSVAQMQELYLIAHNFYKASGNDEKRWQSLRDGVRYDPQTHLGLGFRGMLAMNGQGEVGIPYGWFPKDFTGGNFKWNIEMGCKKIFRYAGSYEIELTITDNKTQKIILQNVELHVGEQVIKAKPAAATIDQSNKACVFTVTLNKAPSDNSTISLNISGNGEGVEEARGTITAKPVIAIK